MTTLQKQWQTKLVLQAALGTGAGALIVWSMWWAEFDLGRLLNSGEGFLEFFSRLTPPDWSVTGLVVNSTLETLMITLSGTFLAVLVGLPLGFLAASNVTPPWVCFPLKVFLGFIRSIPLIVVAVLFAAVVGLGPFPGALAIAFHSAGMLGKFYAEEFETANEGVIRAVRGTGASWAQTLRFGLLPQCVPQVVAFTVYRFEMNFRDATILGFVGAGGIGLYIQTYVRSFQYEKVAVLLMVIIAVVFMLDQLTFWVRKWVN